MARTNAHIGIMWSTAMLDDLERLYAIKKGDPSYMTVGEIAIYIKTTYPQYKGSLTRNAVMSKIHSIKLHLKYPREMGGTFGNKGNRTGHPKKKRPKPRPVKPHYYAKRHDENLRAAEARAVEIAKEEAEAAKQHTSEFNVAWADAADTQCKWPVSHASGTTIVCGAPIWNNGSFVRPSVYCVHHAQAGSGGLPQVAKKGEVPTHRRGRAAPRFS